MLISSIRLQNIRAHTDSSYEFEDGVNILIGPNACGKTTILESIAYVSRGKMPGSSAHKDMYRDNTDWQRVDIDYESESRSFKSTEEKKEFVVSGDSKKRLSHQDIRPIVWFDPEELRLLRGSPKRRRDYFDALLSQLDPSYQLALGRYKRSLLQRNTLLKKAQIAPDDLFVWDLRLAENAEIIFRQRSMYVAYINQALNDIYHRLAGSTKDLRLEYETTENANNYSASLLGNFKRFYTRDQALGFTSAGVHRDDFIFIDSAHKKIATNASRGEIRTVMLALKILETERLTQHYHTKPIILFDDVFSELDGSRRKAFTETLKGHQTIITTTDADIVTKDFAARANVIAVETQT